MKNKIAQVLLKEFGYEEKAIVDILYQVFHEEAIDIENSSYQNGYDDGYSNGYDAGIYSQQ